MCLTVLHTREQSNSWPLARLCDTVTLCLHRDWIYCTKSTTIKSNCYNSRYDMEIVFLWHTNLLFHKLLQGISSSGCCKGFTLLLLGCDVQLHGLGSHESHQDFWEYLFLRQYLKCRCARDFFGERVKFIFLIHQTMVIAKVLGLWKLSQVALR